MSVKLEKIAAPLIVAGIVGFFANWARMEQKFSDVAERLARIETTLQTRTASNVQFRVNP